MVPDTVNQLMLLLQECGLICTIYSGSESKEELAEQDAAMAAQIPIGGKLGNPSGDLVPMLVFLASEGAHFISGQSFPIDGGWLHMR